MSSLSVRPRLETAFIRGLLGLPDAVVGRLAGAPIMVEGQRLDPRVQLVLRVRRIADKKKAREVPLPEARRDLDIAGNQLAIRPPPPLARVSPATVGGRPARIYMPLGIEQPSPALLYLHGGGFVLGSLDSHDGVCRQLAAQIPAVVVALDYRLAPEDPFPAAADDALAGFRDLVGRAPALGLDPSRVGVGGDSAGGNLATVVALETRSDAVRPTAQLVIYPVLDWTLSLPSHGTLGKGFLLENEDLRWYRESYLVRTPPDHPRASPWFVDDLTGLPPAVVVTAGFDPLRDEGAAWAKRLRSAGSPASHVAAPGLFHGFWNCSGSLPAAADAFEAALAAFRPHLLTS